VSTPVPRPEPVRRPELQFGHDVTISEDCPPSIWDAYVDSHPGATPYHRQAFRGVFDRAFGHPSHYLAATRGGRLSGVLPLVEFQSALFGRFAVSLPFVNYGGVLADDDDVALALAEHATALAAQRRWAHVELRHTAQRFAQWPSRRHKVAMCRSLPGSQDALWHGIDRKVRNLVRKAEKAGCTVDVGGAELVADFYPVFARNMRDLGTPVYAKRLFDEVVGSLAGAARVFVVRVGAVPVAGAVTIGWRDRVEVPWASSLRAHADKSPNMLLYWAMLRHAVEQDARVFDFGRSTPDEGTYHFKRQWGAEPQPLVWEYPGLTGALPDHSPKNPKFGVAIAVWQKLPVAVATRIGPHIVRNIP
jgi:serine/alanine adding enzyme